MNNVSLSYVAGLVCGIVFVGLLCFTASKFLNKLGGARCRYDERQLLCQGRAYKIAFYTLIGYLCAAAIFDLATGIKWCDQYTGMLIGIFLSVGVFAVVCIFTDAYVPLNNRPVRTLWILAVLGVMNIGIGLTSSGPIIENGILTHNCTNLFAGVLLLILTALQGVKLLLDKRGDAQ